MAQSALADVDRPRTIVMPVFGETLAAIQARADDTGSSAGIAARELIEIALIALNSPAEPTPAPPPPSPPQPAMDKPRLSPSVLRAWQADGGADFLTRMIELGVRAQAAEQVRQSGSGVR